MEPYFFIYGLTYEKERGIILLDKDKHAIFIRIQMSREDIKMDNQRYGMLFDTSSNTHYYYDAGTGKVISCTKKEKKFIEQILDGRIDVEKAKEIDREFRAFVEEENLFSNHEWSFSVPTKSEFIDLVRGHCQQIVLELTEACNLRCEYCIYNEHHPDYRGYSDTLKWSMVFRCVYSAYS